MYFLGIEAFLAIVQTQNLTKAADLLNLSQSTVSYRLKILEQQMGAMLIERNKGIQTVHLTPFGETFVVIAERWNLLKRETEILQSQGPQVNLVIGAADSLNIYVLPPLYQAMQAHHPEIDLMIRTQHTLESYESVERREVDIAFVKMVRNTANVVVEPFFIDKMVLVRLADRRGSLSATIAPEELDSRQELYLNWGPDYQLWHEKWWNPNCPSRICLDAAALIFSLFTDLRQWAVVPYSIANYFVQSGRFVLQELTDPAPARICYKIMHKYPKPPKLAGIDVLLQRMKELYPKTQM